MIEVPVFLPFTRFIRLLMLVCNAKGIAIAFFAFFLVFRLAAVFGQSSQIFLCIF